MQSLAKKIEVLQLLGTGLSVSTLLIRTGLSYEDLCEMASDYLDLGTELKRWYPRYDFTVKPKEEPMVEVKPEQNLTYEYAICEAKTEAKQEPSVEEEVKPVKKTRKKKNV